MLISFKMLSLRCGLLAFEDYTAVKLIHNSALPFTALSV